MIPSRQEGLSRRKLSYLLLFAAVVAVSSVLLITVAHGGLSGGDHASTSSSQTPTSTTSGCSRPPGYFLIIANESGFNGSADYSTSYLAAHPWPAITVKQGQTVNIIVCNTDPTFAHGFEIDNYLPGAGVTLQPGSTYTFTFVANEAGGFTFRCTIFCPVHIWMQYGRIVVTS